MDSPMNNKRGNIFPALVGGSIALVVIFLVASFGASMLQAQSDVQTANSQAQVVANSSLLGLVQFSSQNSNLGLIMAVAFIIMILTGFLMKSVHGSE